MSDWFDVHKLKMMFVRKRNETKDIWDIWHIWHILHIWHIIRLACFVLNTFSHFVKRIRLYLHRSHLAHLSCSSHLTHLSCLALRLTWISSTLWLFWRFWVNLVRLAKELLSIIRKHLANLFVRLQFASWESLTREANLSNLTSTTMWTFETINVCQAFEDICLQWSLVSIMSIEWFFLLLALILIETLKVNVLQIRALRLCLESSRSDLVRRRARFVNPEPFCPGQAPSTLNLSLVLSTSASKEAMGTSLQHASLRRHQNHFWRARYRYSRCQCLNIMSLYSHHRRWLSMISRVVWSL